MWRLGCAVVAVAAVAAFAWSPSFRDEVGASVAQQPTPFTELFLDDHASLPRQVTPGVPATFHFTIANHEGRAVAYDYRVTVTGANGSSAVAQRATVEVGAGASTSIAATFTTTPGSSSSVISVELVDRTENVHFEVRS